MTLAPEATIPDLEVRTIEEAEAKPIDWARLSRLLGQYKGQKPAPRVLVIDDEADNRTLLSRAAGQNRWQVSEAANGWLGLRSVVEAPPDLILLDLMMPEMDGFEFLRLVRTSQAGQAIPVVVVTAKELTAEDRLRLSGSVHKILQKGWFDREGLFREIESLVTAHVGRRGPRPRSSRSPAWVPTRTRPSPICGGGSSWPRRSATRRWSSCGRPTKAPARSRSQEWITWSLLMLAARVGALVVGQKLFW